MSGAAAGDLGFEQLATLLRESRAHLEPRLERAADLAADCLQSGGKLLVAGNGGSAAEAQHFAAELVGRFLRDRRALPAVALHTDTSALTAIGNDYGFDRVFSRQVEALGRAGDVLVVLSTSGNSSNVTTAVATAREIGCKVIALTGRGGGKLAQRADVLVDVPATSVPRIQEVHLLCLHVLAGALERRLCEEADT